MEDAAFETGPTDHEDHEPPEWAIEAAKAELHDDASAEEIRTRAVEMVKEEQGAQGLSGGGRPPQSARLDRSAASGYGCVAVKERCIGKHVKRSGSI